MLILALDTTLAACSAALYDSTADRVVARQSEAMQQGHAERLAGMVREVVEASETSLDDLGRIAVTVGPGTFTGVRIGLAMARGMARALDVPAVGVTTLEAIAANVTDNPTGLPITVIMDARRQAAYVQSFSAALESLDEPKCLHLADITAHPDDGPCIIVGSGADLIGNLPDGWQRAPVSALPDPGNIARLASAVPDGNSPPLPLYLRPADAKPQARQVKLAPVSVQVTQAGAAHAEILSVMHSECFVTGWSADDLAQMLNVQGTTALIATPEGNEAPAGFILARQAGDEAEIITICVRPNSRRRSVAAQLLAAIVDRLKAAGTRRLFLEVRADNVAAKALYGQAGFSEAGLRKGYYKLEDGSRADATVMALALQDGNDCA